MDGVFLFSCSCKPNETYKNYNKINETPIRYRMFLYQETGFVIRADKDHPLRHELIFILTL